jgi:hypothetical protein
MGGGSQESVGMTLAETSSSWRYGD